MKMRFKIISITPQIIDVSTNEESSFLVGSTIVHYQILESLSPIRTMEVTSEYEGQPTIETIQYFIKRDHERPNLTK